MFTIYCYTFSIRFNSRDPHRSSIRMSLIITLISLRMTDKSISNNNWDQTKVTAERNVCSQVIIKETRTQFLLGLESWVRMIMLTYPSHINYSRTRETPGYLIIEFSGEYIVFLKLPRFTQVFRPLSGPFHHVQTHHRTGY